MSDQEGCRRPNRSAHASRRRLAALFSLVALASIILIPQVAGAKTTGKPPTSKSSPTTTTTTTTTATTTTTTTTTTIPPAPPHGPAPSASIAPEASFIESAQLANGAIQTYPGSAQVDPYMGSYAAMGLARAASLSKSQLDALGAWGWVDWYSANENSSGYVMDANVVGGTTQSTGNVDSTDATAGVYLMAAEAAWQAYPASSQLSQNLAGFSGALSAIESTLSSQNLTWALPSYQVAYLMDETEVYGGLVAAEQLASAAGNAAMRIRAANDASKISSGIAGLWTPSSFDWAAFPSGARTTNNWSVLYPDDLEQVWAVAFGLTSNAQSSQILSTFLADQPTWDQPQASATQDVNGQLVSQSVLYWPVVVWALATHGDTSQAATGEASIRAAAASTASAWPYTPGTAGQLIVGESLLDGLSAF